MSMDLFLKDALTSAPRKVWGEWENPPEADRGAVSTLVGLRDAIVAHISAHSVQLSSTSIAIWPTWLHDDYGDVDNTVPDRNTVYMKLTY